MTMADGSQSPESKKSALRAEDDLSLVVSKALALSDVLNTMANGDGADSLHHHTLSTYTGMLYELLHDARAILDRNVDARIAAKRAEVAHAQN
jgi:hypothetical protein